MQDNQGDSLTFTTNSTQTFAKSYANSAIYSVTVVTEPAGQTCTLSSNATGTITSNITVMATCTTNVVNDTISVGVTDSTGTLVVQDSKLRQADVYDEQHADFRNVLCERLNVFGYGAHSADRTDLHSEQQLDRNHHFKHHSDGRPASPILCIRSVSQSPA